MSLPSRISKKLTATNGCLSGMSGLILLVAAFGLITQHKAGLSGFLSSLASGAVGDGTLVFTVIQVVILAMALRQVYLFLVHGNAFLKILFGEDA